MWLGSWFVAVTFRTIEFDYDTIDSMLEWQLCTSCRPFTVGITAAPLFIVDHFLQSFTTLSAVCNMDIRARCLQGDHDCECKYCSSGWYIDCRVPFRQPRRHCIAFMSALSFASMRQYVPYWVRLPGRFAI